MQPATTRRCALPDVLCCAISTMVSTDSCLALSINEQVFTTRTSADSASEVMVAPASARRPIITSLSTRFLGQPRLTNPILGRETCCPGMVGAGLTSRLFTPSILSITANACGLSIRRCAVISSNLCRVLRDAIPPTPPGPEGSNGNGLMRVQWVTRRYWFSHPIR